MRIMMNFAKCVVILMQITLTLSYNLQSYLYNRVEHYKHSAGSATEGNRFYKIPLDSSGKVNLFWSVDYGSGRVQFEVHAYLRPKQWIAIGFSDYGQLENGDYCVLWANWKGKYRLQDAYSDSEGVLSTKETQDCKDFNLMLHGNLTIFSYTRAIDTCDDKDYIIEDGTTDVLWAIGNGLLPFGLNGLQITTTVEHGFQKTQILKNPNAAIPLTPDVWSFEAVTNKVKVPSKETTYWCYVVKLPPQFSRKHHVVQFESVIQKGNEPLVHHMEFFHCEAPAGEAIPMYNGDCFGKERPKETQVCKRVIAAWAMGALPFIYPKETGLPVGGPDYSTYAMLEIHYNNPGLRADWVDSSGLRIYITDKLRQYDAAVMELGLEYIDKMAIPPGQKQFPLTGYCVAECTGIALPEEGIIVFGSQLHAHLTGVKIYTKHIRDGKELMELNRDNYYSQHFQEIRLLKRFVHVAPGDALVTTCFYDTSKRDNITLGGFAITDEMCVNYIYYYPKADLEVCKSSISDHSLNLYFKTMNRLENQETSPKLGISDNYKAIEWTPIRTNVLDYLYKESPIYMQCNRSTGERFPGDWSNVPVTRIQYPLPPKTRNCSSRNQK